MISQLLPRSFYTQQDVVMIAKDLLGKELVTVFNGVKTSGIITETEAYAGVHDRASHAWNGRLTKRTSTMYLEGGVAYVYLCYGIHALFNIVTAEKGVPHAVLIRGIHPFIGFETILRRSGKKKPDKNFGNGPGKVSRLLGITLNHNGYSLLEATGSNQIFVQDSGFKVPSSQIQSTTRIGIEYAGIDALLPYRFFIPNEGIANLGIK